MRFRSVLSCSFLFAFGLSACALHPLPENVQPFNTVQIVERIRCEAAKSLQQEIINLLKEETPPNPLGQRLQDHPEEFQNFPVTKLRTAKERYFYHRYIMSGIALAFNFDISVDAANNAEVDLLKAISGGTVSLNLKAGNDRMRENTRALVVAETFKHLLDDRNVCTQAAAMIERQPPYETWNQDIPNFAYPISGSIGVFEVVQTFVNLNEEGLLSAGATDKAPVLTDTLLFTTTLTGSVNPQVVLNPVGTQVDLKLATATGSVMRKDANKVSIALSLYPDKGYGAAPALGPFGGVTAGARVFARRTGDPAVQRALDAITQQRIDNFYDRFQLPGL